jgi:HSP20 family protein
MAGTSLCLRRLIFGTKGSRRSPALEKADDAGTLDWRALQRHRHAVGMLDAEVDHGFYPQPSTQPTTPMKLLRSNPSFFVRDFDTWFRHPFSGLPVWAPSMTRGDRLPVDFHEDKESYQAVFELPGVQREAIKLELHQSLLTISAEQVEKCGDQEARTTLSRSITVPDDVNADAISAKLEDGILTLTLPKAEHRKPRSITLN